MISEDIWGRLEEHRTYDECLRFKMIITNTYSYRTKRIPILMALLARLHMATRPGLSKSDFRLKQVDLVPSMYLALLRMIVVY